MGEDKFNILLDTDIGGDIDDALALAMILRSDELNLIGITTVYGDVHVRSKIADKLLEASEITDIPIAYGLSKPLLQTFNISPVSYQSRILREGEKYNSIERENAMELIPSLCSKYYRKFKMVCIGPLTNMAQVMTIRASQDRIVWPSSLIICYTPGNSLYSERFLSRPGTNFGLQLACTGHV